MKNKIGRSLLGKISFPVKVKKVEATKNEFEIELTYRSNFGQRNLKTTIGIEFNQDEGVLTFKPLHHLSTPLPLFLVQTEEVESYRLTDGEQFKLLKPNHYFSKRFETDIKCKKGIMTINLCFLHLENPNLFKTSKLELYPSVIHDREYLVIEVSGIEANIEREVGESIEAID